ncbi:MAG TPA: hypothetical protein ENN17_09490 [bacterium]|nr:hypothetical protein [bacterium]
MFRHYKAIAEAVDIPIVVYNVPGRTGSNILPDTLVRLSEIENILGVKEASGNIAQIGEMAVKLPSRFKMISGDDANTLPLIAYGGCGLISVASNEIPAEMTRFTCLCLDGHFDEAVELYKKIYPLLVHNFVTVNPVPVKAALAIMGKIREVYRLPLVPMESAPRKKMEEILRGLGVI